MENGGDPAHCLVLVGCGKMGTAMLRGWVAAGVASSCVVVEPTGLPAGFGSTAEIAWYSSPRELSTELRPDAVVFAVKPQIADEVVANYRSWAAPETLFVSIVAGKTVAGLARQLGRAAIVRTMPNTPAAIGRGITVACANPLVTVGQRQLCDRLLAAIGESGPGRGVAI
jgi:pyrroline-5-carboxylate reductase